MKFDIDLYMESENYIKTASTKANSVVSIASSIISMDKPKTLDCGALTSILSKLNTTLSGDMSKFISLFSQWKSYILEVYQQESSFSDQYLELEKQIQEITADETSTKSFNLFGILNKKVNTLEEEKQELTKKAEEMKMMLEWAGETAPEIPSMLKRTGATIANGVVSLTEGLGKFVEGLVDFGVLVGTAVKSVGTLIDDGVGYLASKVTGKEYKSLTKKMWDDTKAFVSEDHVGSWYDSFYENTKVGQFVKNNSLHFDSVRKISSGVGYIAGIIILTAATCGVGGVTMATPLVTFSSSGAAAGAAAAGSAAIATAAGSTAIAVTTATATAGASITITAGSVVAGGIAAVAGIGKNTGAAWSDGASTIDGLKYGLAAGAYEGFQMFAGMAVNTLKLGADIGINSLSHVVLDAGDGASSGFIDPLFKSLYSPNDKNMEQIMKYINYDENGNKINDKKWEELTFGEKYTALFKSNGGWETVKTGAITAAIVSSASELKDVAGAIKAGAVAGTGISVAKSVDPSMRLKPGADVELDADGNVAYVMAKDTGYKQPDDLIDAEVKPLEPGDPEPVYRKVEKPKTKTARYEKVRDPKLDVAEDAKYEPITKGTDSEIIEGKLVSPDEIPLKARDIGGIDTTRPDNVIYAGPAKGADVDADTVFKESTDAKYDVTDDSTVTLKDVDPTLKEADTKIKLAEGLYAAESVTETVKRVVKYTDLDADQIAKYTDTYKQITGRDIDLTEATSDKMVTYLKNMYDAKTRMEAICPAYAKLYAKCSSDCSEIDFFVGFEDHNFVHVMRVADTSVESLDSLTDSFRKLDIEGYSTSAEALKDRIFLSAVGHDIGMANGGIDKKTLLKIDLGSGKEIRDSHGLNSAIFTLKNRELLGFGSDTEFIAIIQVGHTKSGSGLLHIGSESEFTDLVDRVVAGAKECECEFDISTIVKVGPDGLPIMKYITEDGIPKKVYDFKDGVLEDLRSGTADVRLSDGHAPKTGFNQANKKLTMLGSTSAEKVALNEKYENLSVGDLATKEVEDIKVKLEPDGTEITDSTSKAYVAGEGNVDILPVKTDNGGRIVYTYVVKSTDTPASTVKYGIGEKFGEYASVTKVPKTEVIAKEQYDELIETAKTLTDENPPMYEMIPQKVVVELPEGSSPELVKFYERKLIEMRKIAMDKLNIKNPGDLEIEILIKGGN